MACLPSELLDAVKHEVHFAEQRFEKMSGHPHFLIVQDVEVQHHAKPLSVYFLYHILWHGHHIRHLASRGQGLGIMLVCAAVELWWDT